MREDGATAAPVNRRRQIRMTATELAAFLQQHDKAALATFDR